MTARDHAHTGADASVPARQSADDVLLALYANAIVQSGRYQLVERFERRARYHTPDGTPRRRAVFVDVETTGLDAARDEIIQLALVPFDYGLTDGRIFDVLDCVTFLEEPTVPIREEITELTGISDADVRGHRIDDAQVEAIVRQVDLVIAHNASFDRRFLERRLPLFVAKAWACSRDDVPWSSHGFSSTKLEWLSYKLCRMFYDAHRADSDCYMAVHLLASRLPSGAFVMHELLRSARATTARISAIGAPFETKEQLKRRGYRWSDGTDGTPKAWWRAVPEADLEGECDWLRDAVYAPGRLACVIHRLDATWRYSGRLPKQESQQGAPCPWPASTAHGKPGYALATADEPTRGVARSASPSPSSSPSQSSYI